MKTFLKFTLVWAVVFTAMGVQATNIDTSLHVKKEQGKSIRFALKEVEQMELSIIDTDGTILFSEKVASCKVFNRSYNLSEFPSGTYYLETETDKKVVRYKIQVSEKLAFLSNEVIVETIKPVLKEESGLVSIQIDNPDKKPIDLSIYDSQNNEVYSETFNDASTLNKKFDISKVDSKQYTFVMTYSNTSFVKSIAMK